MSSNGNRWFQLHMGRIQYVLWIIIIIETYWRLLGRSYKDWNRAMPTSLCKPYIYHNRINPMCAYTLLSPYSILCIQFNTTAAPQFALSFAHKSHACASVCCTYRVSMCLRLCVLLVCVGARLGCIPARMHISCTSLWQAGGGRMSSHANISSISNFGGMHT